MQALDSSLENTPPTSKDESENFVPMPHDMREAVADLLAKILVADYQLFRGVTEPSVKTPPVFNRRLKLVPPGEKAGYSS